MRRGTSKKHGWRRVGEGFVGFSVCIFLSSSCVFSSWCLLLVLFLRGALRSGVAVRGCNLKKKGWRGVGGEGAAPPPQMHSAPLHLLFFLCIFFVFFLRFFFVVFF